MAGCYEVDEQLAIVTTLLTLVACGTPTQPRATPPPRTVVHVGAGEERPSTPTATAPTPDPMTVPIYFGRKAVLLADAACFDKPQRRVLGYRALPPAEVEVVYFLIGEEREVCRRATYARAELLLGDGAEQKATCGSWWVEACDGGAQYLALASPPFEKVTSFDRLPDWRGLDEQSDGLGQPPRKDYVSPVPGTSLLLRHFRDGVTVLTSGAKNVDAFRARAFFLLDDTPYVLTRDTLVRLEDPPERQLLRSLHTTSPPPHPEPHPWDPQN